MYRENKRIEKKKIRFIYETLYSYPMKSATLLVFQGAAIVAAPREPFVCAVTIASEHVEDAKSTIANRSR